MARNSFNLSNIARKLQATSDDVSLALDRLVDFEPNAGRRRADVQEAIADLQWGHISIRRALTKLGFLAHTPKGSKFDR
jgi:hypothetical protein